MKPFIFIDSGERRYPLQGEQYIYLRYPELVHYHEALDNVAWADNATAEDFAILKRVPFEPLPFGDFVTEQLTAMLTEATQKLLATLT